MDERVVSLLRSAYTEGDGNRSFETILQNSSSPDFMRALFAIASAPTAEPAVRHVAVIALDRLVQQGWFEQVCGPEFRPVFLESVCALAAGVDGPIRKSAEHLVKSTVIAAFYKGQWPNFFDVMRAALGAPGSMRLGLVLANSLCAGLKRVPNAREAAVSFVEVLKRDLLQIVATCGSLELLRYCFSCLARMMPYIEVDAAMGVVVEKAQILGDAGAVSDEGFEQFGVKAWKLYRALLKKSCVEWPVSVFEKAVSVVGSQLPMKVRCGALGFVSDCLKEKTLWTVLGAGIRQLIENLFFPLFVLSDAECETAATDPVSFASENHKISSDFHDLRAGAAHILHSSAKSHQEVIAALVDFAKGLCQVDSAREQSPPAMFGLVVMCSSVMPKFSEVFGCVFEKAGQMAMSGNLLRKAAGLFILSFIPKNLVNQDFLNLAMKGLTDAHVLVQYYSALMLSRAFESMKDADSIKASIPDDMISKFFEAIISLSNEFADFALGDCLVHLVSFFGERTLPVAQGLFQQFMKMGIDHANSNAFDNAVLTFNALQDLVVIMAKYPQQMQSLFENAFTLFIQAIPEITNTLFLQHAFYPAFKFFISEAPFNKQYWTLLSSYNPEFKAEFASLIENLCKKDTNLFASPEIVATLVGLVQQAISTNDDLVEIMPIITGLLMRAPADNESFNSLLPQFSGAILSELGNGETAVVKAANALIISRPQFLGSLAPDVFAQYFQYVLEYRNHEITPIALIHAFHLVASNPEAKVALIQALATMLETTLYCSAEDDSDMEDDESCMWFTTTEIVNASQAFFTQLREHDPSLFSVLTEAQLAVINKSI